MDTTDTTEWSDTPQGPDWEPCRTRRRGGDCDNWTSPQGPSKCWPCRDRKEERQGLTTTSPEGWSEGESLPWSNR